MQASGGVEEQDFLQERNGRWPEIQKVMAISSLYAMLMKVTPEHIWTVTCSKEILIPSLKV